MLNLIFLLVRLLRSVPDLYSESLISAGVLNQDEVTKAVSEHTEWLNDHFRQMETHKPERSNLKENWSAMKEPGSSVTYWDTGLPHGKRFTI